MNITAPLTDLNPNASYSVSELIRIVGSTPGNQKEKRQTPAGGCTLSILVGGVPKQVIDLSTLGSSFTAFQTPNFVPSSNSSNVTYLEECHNVTSYPIIEIANATITTAGLGAPTGSSMLLPTAPSSITQSSGSMAPGQSSLPVPGSSPSTSYAMGLILPTTSSITPLYGSSNGVQLSPTSGANFIGSQSITLSPSSIGGQLPPVSYSISANQPSVSSRSTVTVYSQSQSSAVYSMSYSLCRTCGLVPTVVLKTQSSAAPATCSAPRRGTTTLFTTIFPTTCPQSPTCPNNAYPGGYIGSGSSSGDTSSEDDEPGEYGPGISGSGVAGGSGGFITPSSSSTPAGSTSVPICPGEAPGRTYWTPYGDAYAVYCDTNFLDPNIASFQKGTFDSCIVACDVFNTQHLADGSPCKGVTYFQSSSAPNCFFKASMDDPVQEAGWNGAKLLTPYNPQNDTMPSGIATVVGSMTITQPPSGTGSGPNGGGQGGGSAGGGITVVSIATTYVTGGTPTVVGGSTVATTVLTGGSSVVISTVMGGSTVPTTVLTGGSSVVVSTVIGGSTVPTTIFTGGSSIVTSTVIGGSTVPTTIFTGGSYVVTSTVIGG